MSNKTVYYIHNHASTDRFEDDCEKRILGNQENDNDIGMNKYVSTCTNTAFLKQTNGKLETRFHNVIFSSKNAFLEFLEFF